MIKIVGIDGAIKSTRGMDRGVSVHNDSLEIVNSINDPRVLEADAFIQTNILKPEIARSPTKKEVYEFIKNSDIYSNRVEIIYEEKLLGTAGTIKQIIDKYQPSELLVMHGDNYFEDDLKNMFEAFLTREKNFIGTIGTFITSQPENCGILLISQERIEKIIEKSSDNYGNIANSAIYFFDKNALEKIKLLNDSQNDLSIDFIPSIVQELKPIALEGVFIDIGTPENLNKARLHAESN
jgi:NDP-sugar pyrophosphorylase family protein